MKKGKEGQGSVKARDGRRCGNVYPGRSLPPSKAHNSWAGGKRRKKKVQDVDVHG